MFKKIRGESAVSNDVKSTVKIRIIKLLNVFLVWFPFFASWIFYFSKFTNPSSEVTVSVLISVIFIIVFIWIGRIYDAFQISLSKKSEMVYSQVLSEVITDCFMFLIVWMIIGTLPSILVFVFILLAQIVLSVLWVNLASHWYFRTNKPKKTAVVYEGEEQLEKLMRESRDDKKFDISQTLLVNQVLENLDTLNEAEVVFLSGVRSHDRNIILKYCVENGITVYIIPRVGDVIMSGAHPMHMYHLPILQTGRFSPSPEYLVLKRLMDIVISGFSLVILSPVFLITYFLVRLDGGPALYKQERLTQDGKTFNVLKFRSMRVDAEKDGIARLSSGDDDPRVTPIGKFIRKVRLDELPQLINILKGEMSIVGPRPERPSIAKDYETTIPEFRLRLQAKAGLTGYAQVYGKYNTQPYDKLLLDLTYISNPSILEDIRIMFATIKILFIKESTEGVSKDQITAG